ncbi:NAD(P)H-dependent oxidoreductase [Apilactobacillus timberlakei]|uniref:Flavodoxin family protein n=1 Tax=Apilactobacillus timberlakei TaxID=2008380 RepID=A0ABY2YUC7_9LACO|nr:NAD(P)H-dependent oxidoreductase [Apilactobacillus timberlakei]TPR14752.1 flavodoxin family protein [Apilactobacillus timberlakei]TPR15719.1 flavodoxin family protein [Apilactobacillus timberlakei]TPR16080.1 flavodoxin family protein [Apilactobacillus timberlakei]
MKTLVIVSHPEYDNSMTESFLQQCQNDIDEVDWLVLDHLTNNYEFDIDKEQNRLIKYDRILLQFPMYWYSSPALLKKYEDDIFTRSFTYANEDGKLKGKELGIITTLGEPLKNYTVGGSEGFSINEILKPYQALAFKSGMKFIKPFAVDQFAYMTDDEKGKLLVDYRNYLTNEDINGFGSKQIWYLSQLKQLRSNLSSEKQAKLDIIIDYLQDNYDRLDEIKWELDMIKKEED